MKKHVFFMKDVPQVTDQCQLAYKKAALAYAKNCLPHTYTMIFVLDKQVFKDQIGREAAKNTKNYTYPCDFTTKSSFYTINFKLSADNKSYLFKENGMRQLCLTCNEDRQIAHFKKVVGTF
jgi:hypothetical protein